MAADFTLNIIKLAASVIAAFYGVYATVTDFHENQGGKKVLSRRGYLGIALLLITSLLNIGTELFKEALDREGHKKQEDASKERLKHELKVEDSLTAELDSSTKISSQLGKTSRILEEDSRNTAFVLREARRGSDPLEDINFIQVGMILPVDSKIVRPYLQRVMDESGWSAGFTSGFGRPDFPDATKVEERVFSYLAVPDDMTMRITSKNGELYLGGRCDTQHFYVYVAPKISGKLADNIGTSCYIDHVLPPENHGQLRSHFDLVNAVASVEVSLYGRSIREFAHLSGLSMDDFRVIRALPLSITLTFREKNGRSFRLEYFKQITHPNLSTEAKVYFTRTIQAGDVGLSHRR